MPDIRSSGIFSDRKSAGGLYRGSYINGQKVPGIPIELVSGREVFKHRGRQVKRRDSIRRCHRAVAFLHGSF